MRTLPLATACQRPFVHAHDQPVAKGHTYLSTRNLKKSDGPLRDVERAA